MIHKSIAVTETKTPLGSGSDPSCSTTDPPAVLVEGKDIAAVLNACNTQVVPMLGGKYLIREVVWAPARVGVLWPVVPQYGHHHVSCQYKSVTNIPWLYMDIMPSQG